MWKVLAVTGMGLGAIMLYKICNPNCVQDMKNTLDNVADSASKKMKNMME